MWHSGAVSKRDCVVSDYSDAEYTQCERDTSRPYSMPEYTAT